MAARAHVASAVNAGLRKGIFAAADSGRVKSVVRRHGMRLGAGRFVAGETLDDCIVVLRRLNDRGLWANTTLLGEGVHDRPQAEAVVVAYEEVIDRIATEKLNANVALKLTHLGLEIGEELAYENVQRLVRRADAHGQFIRIDMEQFEFVDATLRIYRRLRDEASLANVGTVLQAYLYRTPADLESLLPLAPNLRIVKGAYLESPDVAYPRKADVDEAYLRLVEALFAGGAYAAVATHDERLIEHVISFAEREGIARERFQFQMLYGIRSKLQVDLVQRGFEVLVATPYGPDWYRYLMRRLAERPANLLFFARSFVRR